MRRRSVFLLWTAAVIAIVTSCGRTEPGDTSARRLAGRVANYTSGSALLDATVLIDEGVFLTEATIGSGTVAADGEFEFTFHSTVDSRGLSDLFSGSNLCDGVAASAAPKGGVISTLTVNQSGRRIGVIGRASGIDVLEQVEAGGPPVGSLVAWLYVDRDARILGTCSDASSDYDLELTTGWNMIEIAVSDAVLTLRSLDAPAGVEWLFLSSPSEAGAGDFSSIVGFYDPRKAADEGGLP